MQRVPVVPGVGGRVYALKIVGDSMSPQYRAGDYLICQDIPPEALLDGDDAVVQCDGSRDGASTFKRCVIMGKRVKLVPLNPAYPSMECELDAIIRVGKVTGTYRPR